jgi:hypothetical protein
MTKGEGADWKDYTASDVQGYATVYHTMQLPSSRLIILENVLTPPI